MTIKEIVQLEKENQLNSIGEKTYLKLNPKFITKVKSGKIIAFIAYLEHEKYFEIINLAVDKNFRNIGIATWLIDQIPKVKRIYLEVNKNNTAAIKLYEKNNFIIERTILNYYHKTDDALIMYFEEISENAYAKVNYLLNVKSKRPDKFHNINFIMDKINLSDLITIKTTNRFKLICPEISEEKDNLVFKAYQLMKNHQLFPAECQITVKKNIPVAAGLAGGSSDAASTMRILNKLWSINFSESKLAKLSLELGSDVPFCIYQKFAYVSGRGEKIKLLKNPPPSQNIIVINNRKPLFTKLVFSNHKVNNNTLHFQKTLRNIENNNFETFYQDLSNDLEPTASQLMPEITEIINLLQKHGIKSVMAGSGPTVIGFSHNLEKLNQVKGEFNPDWFIKIIHK